MTCVKSKDMHSSICDSLVPGGVKVLQLGNAG